MVAVITSGRVSPTTSGRARLLHNNRKEHHDEPCEEFALVATLDVAVSPATMDRQRLQVRSFADLDALPPEPEWILRGMLAVGALTMLTAQPFAGKSMLVGGLLKALDEGEQFLGLPTRRTSALLVTEEDEVVLRSRAAGFNLRHAKSRHVTRADSYTLKWEELVQDAAEQAHEGGHELLVFDTFAGLAGLQGEEENDTGAITSRLRHLKAAAAKGLAVLFLHHMNGYGQPRGSKAFKAMVDISLLLNRPSHSPVLTISGEGRFPAATPQKLRAKLVDSDAPWFYEALASGSSTGGNHASSAATEELLLKALADASPSGLTVNEIGELEGLSVDIAKKRLPKLHGKKVDRSGAGTKTDPHRWFLLPA